MRISWQENNRLCDGTSNSASSHHDTGNLSVIAKHTLAASLQNDSLSLAWLRSPMLFKASGPRVRSSEQTSDTEHALAGRVFFSIKNAFHFPAELHNVRSVCLRVGVSHFGLDFKIAVETFISRGSRVALLAVSPPWLHLNVTSLGRRCVSVIYTRTPNSPRVSSSAPCCRQVSL